MRVIETEADIEEGLAHLAAIDPRLKPVIAAAGKVPVRRRPAGFAGLANIIVSQQLSAASATAIWRKVEAGIPALSAAAITASDDRLRAMGLSAPKIRTMRAAAAACTDGLDLEALASADPDAARAALTAVKGIGPWTADIYLLFCLGHADIFPAGDLALRVAAAEALDAESVPPSAELAETAALWSPWRGVAACLFWAFYRTLSADRKAVLSATAGGRK